MLNTTTPNVAYTPEQVAKMLQLSKNKVYDLINSGEIVAKKFGKVYRIPASSIGFLFTGLDSDLMAAQKEDLQNLDKVRSVIKDVRKQKWTRPQSS